MLLDPVDRPGVESNTTPLPRNTRLRVLKINFFRSIERHARGRILLTGEEQCDP